MLIVLLFLVAVSIAVVAAYFSITGLVAVFSASAISIIVMGSVLEIGKLVAISYGYRFWNLIGNIQRVFLLFFIVVLMAVTSIGIFGFLSKAHLEKVGPQDQYELRIDRIDEKTKILNNKITRSRKVLNNLDSALDKYIELGFVTRGLEQREEQAPQRTTLEEDIAKNEQLIDDLNEEKLNIKSSIQEIELEVGPIRYIAQMVYGDTKGSIEKAVKILIIMLVCTFDPLAVMLLISANHAHMHRNDSRIRSEFSILREQNTVQSEKLMYDDLSDEEKEEHIQKVKQFLDDLDDTPEPSTQVDNESETKYRDMVYKNMNEDTDTSNVSKSSTERKDDNSDEQSPYNLHRIDKPKKRGLNWLPRKK